MHRLPASGLAPSPVTPRSYPRVARAAWRALPLLLGSLALALLSACTPDTLTAPRAAPGGPSRLLVATPGAYTQVSAGAYHTCALGTGGAATCWGWNTYGQTSVPAGLTGVTQVSAGHYFTCAVGTGGTVTCWGDNSSGQTTVPAGLAGVAQVSAGGAHACALTSSGAVTCWGDNGYGQTTPPAGLAGVTQVSAGGAHACALTSGGAVTCWGNNFYGQATPPAGLAGVTQVSAGPLHTCAVGPGGAVTCWGYSAYGQTSVPAGLTGVTQVSAAYDYTCAVGAGGVLSCWGGNNVYGEATPPAGLAGVTQVTVGNGHTCALTIGGAVTCWGKNDFGESNVPPAPGTTTTHVYPTATFTAAPLSVVVGQPVTLTLAGAQVPGHPEATAFTYAFDCGTGAYGTATSSASASCTPAAAGPLTVRGKVIDQDGDTASYSASVTVSKTAQQITFASTPPSPAYVNDTYTPAATASSRQPVALSLDASSAGVCTLANGTVTFTAAGTCTVVAQQAGTAAYLPAQQTQAVTVSRRSQAFTLTTTLPPSAVVTRTFTLGATPGASGVAVVFRSQSLGTCTTTGANGTTLTLTGAGPCTVWATEVGNASYADAPAQTLGLTVLTPAQATSQLRSAVAGSGIAAAVRQGLTDKLDAASAALAAGNPGAACNQFGAFQTQVTAQRGKAIPTATADAWLAQAAQIRTALGC